MRVRKDECSVPAGPHRLESADERCRIVDVGAAVEIIDSHCAG